MQTTAQIGVEYYNLTDDILVVRSIVFKNNSGQMETVFMSPKQLKNLENGKASARSKNYYVYVTDEFKADYKIRGTYAVQETWTDKKKKLEKADLFDALKSGEFQPSDLSNVATRFYDLPSMELLDGTRVIAGIKFSYLEGHFYNAVYDLEKAHAHLKTLPFVHELSEVEDVPYYNRSNTMNKHLEFFVEFPEAYFDGFNAWCKIKNPNGFINHDPRQYIFEQDILGLRAAGAARFDSYWKSLEIPDDDEDNY